MKIIYKQPQSETVFDKLGIQNCCLKQLFYTDDMKNTTKKKHHHNAFEIHIIEKGHQVYKIGDTEYKIKDGEFLVIPPGVKHNVVDSFSHTLKFSLIFNLSEDKCCFGVRYSRITTDMVNDIEFIKAEIENKSVLSRQLVENRIFELVTLILRQCGYKEDNTVLSDEKEDVRLSIAKQYIKDNIEFNLNVEDVASYCYISTKQLTRLFKSEDGITPAKYIRERKTERIENLLTKTSLTLNEISERLNFSSEHHFNSCFKKYAGMTPGEYRRMNK